MKLSVWRPALTLWLHNHLAIDTWLLSTPDPGQNIGFLPPLRDVTYTETDEAVVTGQAVQDIYLRKRYEDCLYKDLPVATLEGNHSTLALRLLTRWRTIADLTGVDLVQVPEPVAVTELGDRDWLVELLWSFRFTWVAEPEDGNLVEPFEVRSIDLAVWRRALVGQPDLEDYRITLPVTTA